jgi:hypothetical protein
MRGYSLIECLMGICLIGLVSGLSARFTQQSSAQLSELMRAIDQRLAIIKSASVITATINARERSRLADLLVLADGSSLQAPHGGPHPLVGIGTSSKPRLQSSIVSIIEVDPLYQGRIVESRRSVDGATIKVCSVPSIPTAERFRSHVLVGLGGVCQVTGAPQALSSGCFELAGTATRGLLLNSPSCPTGSFHEYLPVSREISVFIDRSGEFRLVSHVGMRLLENQPLTRGLRELKTSWITTGQDTRFLRFSLRASTSKELQFLLPIPLRDSLRWNEILL